MYVLRVRGGSQTDFVAYIEYRSRKYPLFGQTRRFISVTEKLAKEGSRSCRICSRN